MTGVCSNSLLWMRTSNLTDMTYTSISKEGNVLFNNAFNTFYLRLYGVRHMVKDYSDSERGNPLLPHRLLFPISSKGFHMHHHTDRIAHTTAFATPVVEHWLEREIAQRVYQAESIRHLLHINHEFLHSPHNEGRKCFI